MACWWAILQCLLLNNQQGRKKSIYKSNFIIRSNRILKARKGDLTTIKTIDNRHLQLFSLNHESTTFIPIFDKVCGEFFSQTDVSSNGGKPVPKEKHN